MNFIKHKLYSKSYLINRFRLRVRQIAFKPNAFQIYLLLICLFIASESNSNSQLSNPEKHLNLDSLYAQALNLRKAGEYLKAAKLFDEIVILAGKKSEFSLQIQCLMLEAYSFLDLGLNFRADSIVRRMEQLMERKKNLTPEQIANLHFFKAHVLFRYSRYKEALKEYLNSAASKEKNHITDSLLLKTYNNISFIYDYLTEYQKSLDYSIKLVNLAKELFGINNYRLGKYFLNLGSSYFELGNITESMPYFNEAEQIYVANYGRQFEQLSVLFYNKAIVYRWMGDYEKSENFYSIALRIAEDNPTMFHNPTGDILGSLGVFYSVKGENSIKIGDNSQGIEFYKKALDYTIKAVSIKDKEDPTHFAYLYGNLGDYYRAIGDYKRSKKNFDISVKRELKYTGGNEYFLGLCYNEMGILYGDSLKDYTSALKYYKKSYSLFSKLFGLHDARTASSLSYLARQYFNQGQYEKAIKYSHEAVRGISLNFNDTDIYLNPSVSSVRPIKISLEIINTKARILREIYNKDHDLKKLSMAFKTYRLASEIIDRLRPSYESEQSKLALAADENDTYQQLVTIAYQLFQITGNSLYFAEAFKYAEHSKASALLSSMRSNEARQFSGIPTEMLNYESKMRKEIALYQEALYEAPKESNDNKDKVKNLEKKIQNLHLSYDSLILSFEKNYPEYYKLKYQNTSVSIEDVKSFLGEKQVLLEYFLNDTMLYLFVISKEKSEIINNRIDKKFSSVLANFQKSLAFPNFSRHTIETYRQFTTMGHYLFEQLLGKAYSLNKDKDLLIVPDGKMAYLPFDILLTDSVNQDQVDYASLPYLIRKTMVSYNYSSTLMLSRKGRYLLFPRLLAFAPDYKNDQLMLFNNRSGVDYRKRLFPLPGAIEEVESLPGFFNSKILMGESATESNFKQMAPAYSIIHLAMHTIIDNKNPMYSKLAFSYAKDTSNDGMLNTYEIYNLQFNARLAVLSSCNSGNGQFSRGEGVMSLARAFIYAGCPSIVMSLWEIEDRSGAEIIKNFYAQLSKGKPTDQSLRLAKLKFLESADPLTAHPYFWAGYVTIGDTKGMGRHWNIWLICLALALFLTSGILIRRKMKPIRKNRGRNGS
jgi:CHAT domain-containing protein/tetratricopeptide (TPR) repeat protein